MQRRAQSGVGLFALGLRFRITVAWVIRQPTAVTISQFHGTFGEVWFSVLTDFDRVTCKG